MLYVAYKITLKRALFTGSEYNVFGYGIILIGIFYKQTNKIHFIYVFILQFMYNSTCFERPFLSSAVYNFTVHAALYKSFKRA
jgi:hypothetical protein